MLCVTVAQLGTSDACRYVLKKESCLPPSTRHTRLFLLLTIFIIDAMAIGVDYNYEIKIDLTQYNRRFYSTDEQIDITGIMLPF